MELIERDALNAAGSPMRQRLLAALAGPQSAAGLARRFGMSRQRVGYHMREMERAGLIELVERRARRGCTERLYRARALAWVLEAPPPGDAPALAQEQDRYSWAALVNLAGSVLKELAALRRRADRAGKRLATLAIETRVSFGSVAERAAFTDEVTAAIHSIAEKYQSTAGRARRYRLFLGAYPAPTQSRSKHREPE